ncbi:hypothetical protein [Psychrobacillus sp. NPDC093180]|uniref:hypothetical protein n=1 Tax=Psychrobacillus sp. NPDC093180 TaxID=3364489 RepID=UPI0038014AA0
MKIEAYMVNNYYIFTNFNDLSSHIHDVVHFARPMFQNNSHPFSIITGKIHRDQMMFVNDNGETIPLVYEQEDDFYYSAL